MFGSFWDKIIIIRAKNMHNLGLGKETNDFRCLCTTETNSSACVHPNAPLNLGTEDSAPETDRSTQQGKHLWKIICIGRYIKKVCANWHFKVSLFWYNFFLNACTVFFRISIFPSVLNNLSIYDLTATLFLFNFKYEW